MAKRSSQESRQNASPEDRATIYAEYCEAMGDSARVKQRIASILKRGERMGVEPKGIKYAYSQSNNEDATAEHRMKTEYLVMLRIIDVDDAGQASFARALEATLPDGKVKDKLDNVRAYTDGYNSGRAGGLLENCPFIAGTEQFVRWRDGWDDGQRDRRLANPDADKGKQASTRKARTPAASEPNTPPAAPKPRGRPPGSRKNVQAEAAAPVAGGGFAGVVALRPPGKLDS